VWYAILIVSVAYLLFQLYQLDKKLEHERAITRVLTLGIIRGKDAKWAIKNYVSAVESADFRIGDEYWARWAAELRIPIKRDANGMISEETEQAVAQVLRNFYEEAD
jgi:hypothetical protein